MIEKIMDKAQAIKLYKDIAKKLEVEDLSLFDDEKTSEEEKAYRTLIRALMCGLVYWDEEKQCLCQKLLKPLQSGDLNRDIFYYKRPLKVKEASNMKSASLSDLLVECCELPRAIVNEMHSSNDLEIASATMDFFLK